MRFRETAFLLLFALGAAGAEEESAPKERMVAVAVIVHPDNPIKELSLSELRSYLKLERQFWPNKQRCEVYLPPSRSVGISCVPTTRKAESPTPPGRPYSRSGRVLGFLLRNAGHEC